jgi:predicted amidohydrolase
MNASIISPKHVDSLRLGAYQGSTQPQAVDKNAGKLHELLMEAHRREIDFACMPECFLTGYGTPDELRATAVSITGEPFRELVRHCVFDDMVSIFGFTERRGEQLHNSAAIVHRGHLLGVHRKAIAGSPHEKAAVTFVNDFSVFSAHGVTFGVLICFEGFFTEPALLLAERGARVIFEPHYAFTPAAHMDWQRQRVRNSRIARAVENDCWYVKANTVTEPMRSMGDSEGLGYGDSFILDNIGRPLAEAGLFTTGWLTADVPSQELRAQRESRVALMPDEIRQQVISLYSSR